MYITFSLPIEEPKEPENVRKNTMEITFDVTFEALEGFNILQIEESVKKGEARFDLTNKRVYLKEEGKEVLAGYFTLEW